MSNITIRDLTSSADFRAAQDLQLAVWGGDASAVTPDHVLLTAQKNGGLVIGALQETGDSPPALLGFVFGFIGWSAREGFKHCSHQLGVHPGARDAHLGYRLKLAQRERVLAQGFALITWTFDPLESRNGYLNFHKLGVVCNIYYRSLYGAMADELNAGMPSDRCQVDWWIRTPRVADRISGAWRPNTLRDLAAAGVPVLNRGRGTTTLPHPADAPSAVDGPRCLVAIPADIQTIKQHDLGLARAWRLQTRALFEQAFNHGYSLTDLLPDRGRGHSYYLLEQPA